MRTGHCENPSELLDDACPLAKVVYDTEQSEGENYKGLKFVQHPSAALANELLAISCEQRQQQISPYPDVLITVRFYDTCDKLMKWFFEQSPISTAPAATSSSGGELQQRIAELDQATAASKHWKDVAAEADSARKQLEQRVQELEYANAMSKVELEAALKAANSSAASKQKAHAQAAELQEQLTASSSAAAADKLALNLRLADLQEQLRESQRTAQAAQVELEAALSDVGGTRAWSSAVSE